MHRSQLHFKPCVEKTSSSTMQGPATCAGKTNASDPRSIFCFFLLLRGSPCLLLEHVSPVAEVQDLQVMVSFSRRGLRTGSLNQRSQSNWTYTADLLGPERKQKHKVTRSALGKSVEGVLSVSLQPRKGTEGINGKRPHLLRTTLEPTCAKTQSWKLLKIWAALGLVGNLGLSFLLTLPTQR